MTDKTAIGSITRAKVLANKLGKVVRHEQPVDIAMAVAMLTVGLLKQADDEAGARSILGVIRKYEDDFLREAFAGRRTPAAAGPSGYEPETLAQLHAGNVIAQKVNDEIFQPGDVALPVRLFAISSLLAGTAVVYGDGHDAANRIIDTAVDSARGSLQSGFDHLARSGRKQ